MEKLDGGCYCGAIRYQIASVPTWAAHCHCRSCQMALGGAFLTWAKVTAGDFVVTMGKIKTIQKTPGITRGFCEDCGTTLTYDAKTEVEGQDFGSDDWFAASTLDDPSIIEPKSHVFVSHKQAWIKLADNLPTFPEF